MTTLTQTSAIAVVGHLKKGEITPSELLDQMLTRVEQVEPVVNSLVSFCFDRARAQAETLEKKPMAERGLLAGLPITIKDLMPVAGVRTTWGSTLFRDHVPTKSDGQIEHLEAEGGVIYAKSNTPEFGVGGNTFNDVYGSTRNPWDLTLSAGGSSGGAAASLAAHTSWLATGSDNAGSLRTPAAFCGVVGLRPTPFSVPSSPRKHPFDSMAVQGPMARDVKDTAFFLDAMVWADPNAPFTRAAPNPGYLAAAQQPKEHARIAFSPDLGLGNVSAEIAAVVAAAMAKLERSGFEIQASELSLQAMDSAYCILRSLDFATSFGGMSQAERAHFKPEFNVNIDRGLALSGTQIAAAMRERGVAFQRILAQLADCDVLICPATTVAPFPVNERYHGESQGLGAERYLDWLSIAYVLSGLAVPVLAIPCGMTAEGLPVGIQIVGRPNGERALLSVGAAIEAAMGTWATRQIAHELRHS